MSNNINFEFKRVNDVTIFKLNEKRFDASIAGLVKGEFTIVLHTEEIQKMIFDLSEIDYCDSSGLSAILLAFRILQANEGKILLAAPRKNVRSLIEISQLDRVLQMYDTVEEAMDKFINE